MKHPSLTPTMPRHAADRLLHGLVGLGVLSGCSDDGPARGSPELGAAPSTGHSDPSGAPMPGTGDTDTTPTTGDLPGTSTTSITGTSSGSTAATTGAPGPTCGDHVQDDGEACDDGPANSDNGFCTTKCALNFCGDGHVYIGWELCDEGDANSDAYGSSCGTQCEPAPRCGDHIIQADEGEECDLGPDNGGPMGDEQNILCDSSCASAALRAFVTSQTFNGDLGGLGGADTKCRAAATAAGLGEPHRFHAYLSTPGFSANDRFPGEQAAPLPYVLVTGKKLAESHAALLAMGPLGEGLSVTELGTSLFEKYVASNTAPSGASYSPDQHCLAWTSADPLHKARVGLTFPVEPGDVAAWQTGGQWIDRITMDCAKTLFHLYCLEI